MAGSEASKIYPLTNWVEKNMPKRLTRIRLKGNPLASPTTHSTTHHHRTEVTAKRKRTKEHHEVIPTLLELFHQNLPTLYTSTPAAPAPNLHPPLNDKYF